MKKELKDLNWFNLPNRINQVVGVLDANGVDKWEYPDPEEDDCIEIYPIDKLVTFEGDLYISLKNKNSALITDETAWKKLGGVGPKGDTGPQGPKGDTFEYEDLTESDKVDIASRVPVNEVVENDDITAVSGEAVSKYTNKNIDTVLNLRDYVGKDNEVISLLGYYTKGDKETVNYKYTTTQGVDDGGSVINTSSGSWLALFNDTVSVKHFGASNDLSDNIDILQRAINSENPILIDEDLDLQIQITQPPLNNETPKNGIQLLDNTTIVLNGKIRLDTCDFNAYDIIGAYDCTNISITGKGEIIGDVVSHVSDVGEHGMGILIYDCDNVVIEGIKVSKCFADGLILHGKASNVSADLNKNIFVRKVTFDDNRRQGVSILKCDFAVFTECTFKDTGKTKFALPGCGVDIEPEWYQEAKNVKFDKCSFTGNASMGLFIHSNDHTKNIFNVEVINNKFESPYSSDLVGRSLIGISKAFIDEFSFIQNIKILNNTFSIRDYDGKILDIFNNVKDVDIKNNTFVNNITTSPSFNVTCISLSQVKDFNVSGNNTNFGSSFLRVDGDQSKGVNVSDNIVKNISDKCVILNTGCSSISLKNNSFYDSVYGLQATAGIEDLSVVGNSFKNIERWGIYLSWGVKDILIKHNRFKNICTSNSSDSFERNIISLYGDASAKISDMIVSDNIFNNIEVLTDHKYIGRNLSNIDNYIFKDNIFNGDTNPSTKIDLITDPTRIVSIGLASNLYYGFTKISNPVENIETSDATDLETALILVNELKAQLNAKLEADRSSGQQAT